MKNWICMLGGHKEPREITGFRAEDGLLIGRCPRCGGPVISTSMRASTWLRDDVAIAECLEELRRETGPIGCGRLGDLPCYRTGRI